MWSNQAAHASVAGVLPGPRFWGDIVDACELLVDHRVDNPLYDPGRGTRLRQRCRLAVCVDHVAIYPHESGTAPHFLALPNIATVEHFRAEDGSELIAQVYLIEPEVAADKAQAASRKTAYMSVSERLALAEENGVGDLYRRIRDIERSSSSKLFTNSAGRGKVSLTARVKGRSLTILVMELGQSDQASGLRFRLNATRLIEHFELNLEEIQQGLPTSAQPLTPSEWHGAAINTTADWQGFKGNFRSVEEIDNFMAMLQPRTRCT